MRREQPGVIRPGKAVVQQKHHTPVLRCADDPPGGLQHLVHAGIAVGIVESGAVLCIVIAAQHFLLGVHLRQTDPHDRTPDEPVACKIHTLAKNTAQNPKTQQSFFWLRHKLCKKFCPGSIVCAAFLHKRADVRVARCKIFIYLPEIGVAWEKRQIVAGFSAGQPGQCIRNGLHTGFPVAVAGGDIRHAVKTEIFGGEGAGQRHGPGIRAAQYAPIIAGRGKCCTE